MRRITEKEAMELLKKGNTVKCKISSRDVVPVKDLANLKNLLKLKEEGVQSCDIFFEEEEREIPKDAIEISLEDAIELIAEGEIVYGKRKEEEEITTQNVLKQYYRSALRNGNPLLYWYPY